MALLHSVLLFAALFASTEAQLADRATGSTKVLQPWLVGLTAVVVFLFIVFVLMIVNRLACKKKRNTDIDLHSPQGNAYENMALEMEDGNKKGEEQSVSRPSQDMSKSPPEKVEWQPEATEEVKITPM